MSKFGIQNTWRFFFFFLKKIQKKHPQYVDSSKNSHYFVGPKVDRKVDNKGHIILND